jgi:hypothetical protein
MRVLELPVLARIMKGDFEHEQTAIGYRALAAISIQENRLRQEPVRGRRTVQVATNGRIAATDKAVGRFGHASVSVMDTTGGLRNNPRPLGRPMRAGGRCRADSAASIARPRASGRWCGRRMTVVSPRVCRDCSYRK